MDEDQRHKQSNTQYISDIKILILRSSEVIIIENNKILPFWVSGFKCMTTFSCSHCDLQNMSH